ncbi:MAG: adenylyltransferase/cytidyltransferase family protein, partial [Clostridia bacterium]|nr:adenylyltransferase/cytidyltransferase family protein [Clostridia bacterium]
MTKNRIGIFGGTFNPVHKGHVAIAEKFITSFSLDILYIIPNRISPLKDVRAVSGEDRTEMLKIAFSGNNKVRISDIELKREGTSYTCDTVA